jgi:putative alpha-1,2-mannosidase
MSEIMNTLYKNPPEDKYDNGNTAPMSAWNILSTIGFYPIAHGNGVYMIGTYHSPKMTIQTIYGGKTSKWKIVVKNLSSQNIYVNKISLNGNPIDAGRLDRYRLFGKNVRLVFEMNDSPNYSSENELNVSPLSISSNNGMDTQQLVPLSLKHKVPHSLLYRLLLLCVTWNLYGLVAFLTL